MIEAKIGIAIIHCLTKSGGLDVAFRTDEGSWGNVLEDTGKVFSYINPVGALVRMVKFTNHGWYMCSMKPVPGRAEEYRASWIYFPASLNLEGADILNIIEETEFSIESDEIYEQALRKIVLRHSADCANALGYDMAADRSGYAIRYVDDGNPSFFDVLGKIYQREFTEYKWVILMKHSEVELRQDATLRDLTPLSLKESYVIQPPVDDKFGFLPYLNGQQFTDPVRIVEGEMLDVVWKQKGYEDINKIIGNTNSNVIKENDVKKIIEFSQISVESIEGATISYGKITLLPAQLDTVKQRWIVKYSDLSKARFTVNAEGYEPKPEDEIDLSKIKDGQPIKIRLKEKEYIYSFKVCLDVKKEIYTPEYEYKSPKKIDRVPFEGFKLKQGKRPVEKKDGYNILIVDTGKSGVPPTPPPKPNNASSQNNDTKRAESQKPKKRGFDKITKKWICVICFALILLLIILMLCDGSTSSEFEPLI